GRTSRTSTPRPRRSSPPPGSAWRSTRPDGASRLAKSTRRRRSCGPAGWPGCRRSSTRTPTSPRMWGEISTGRRPSPGTRGTGRRPPSRSGSEQWPPSDRGPPRMDDRIRRLNEERFARTAEAFAKSAAVGNLAEIESLVRLAAPAPADLLLDVACGAGRLLKTFAPLVGMAVGADATMEMLRQARRAGPGGAARFFLVRADGSRLQFPDETFTLV